MIYNNRVSCFPTFKQELLLKAAFLKGKTAINAWEEWRMEIDIDQLDRGSFLLLPLLYQNLYSLGIEDKLMDKMKGVHRFTWYNNQILFRNMTKLLDLFHKNGIQTMVIKGASLAYNYYKDPGLRPTGDFDVLIKFDQAQYAIELLQNAGWKEKFSPKYSRSINNLSFINSWGFNDDLGQGFDLHWHLLPNSYYNNADNEFWDKAISYKFYNISTSMMCSTDILLLACIKATVANKITTPIRYLADIMTILDLVPSSIDWHRLVDQASRLHIVLPVRKTLKYVKSTLNAPIPLECIKNLDKTQVSRIDITGYKSQSRTPGFFGYFPRSWALYLYTTIPGKQYGKITILFGFIKYMKLNWELKYIWQVPFVIIYKGVKKFLKRQSRT